MKKTEGIIPERVQLIIKEIGLYFILNELKKFNYIIIETLLKNSCCEDCKLKNLNSKLLLKTPLYPLDLAVSINKLNQIQDLINGTFFKIEMERYLLGEGKN